MQLTPSIVFRKRKPGPDSDRGASSRSSQVASDSAGPVEAAPAKPSPARETAMQRDKQFAPNQKSAESVDQTTSRMNINKEEEERKLYLQNEFLKQKQQQESSSEARDSSGNGQLTVEELYGPGKAYPEPYLAGKVPASVAVERRKQRQEGRAFVYAVRFRSGPFGFTFDNRARDRTYIEKVLHDAVDVI